MDLSSHRVSDEIQLRYHSDNLGEFFYMQISTAIIEKSILFNTVECMHDNVTQIISMTMLMFSAAARHGLCSDDFRSQNGPGFFAFSFSHPR